MNFMMSFLTMLCGFNFNPNNLPDIDYNNKLDQQNMIINQDSINSIKDTQLLSAYLPDEDHFEPNDNISDASEICPDDFYLKDSYSIDVDATLDYVAMLQDIDFYYLTIFTDSYVNISVDIESNYAGNFQFALMNYDYYKIENGYAYHWTEDIFSNYDGTRSIYYSALLKPGTYLIYLRGCQDSSITNVLPYSLKVNVTKNIRTDGDIPIMDIISDEDTLAAVWISDFLPCDNTSIFDLTSEYVYYKPNQTNLDYPDFALDKLREVSNGEPINVATFYIWDNALRHTLHELFVATKNLFLEQIQNQYNENVKLRLQQNTFTNSLEIVATVFGNDLVPKNVSIPVNIISEIGFSVIEMYYSALIQEITPNDVYYSTFLGMLSQAFYVSMPVELDVPRTIENIIKYGIKEITFVPICFDLGIKTSTFPTQNEHYYSFKASSKIGATLDSLIYDDRIFRTRQESNVYSDGKIYKIKSYDDLDDCSQLELAKPHEHVYNGHYCVYCSHYSPNHVYEGHYCIYCNEYTSSHDYGNNYIWVDGLSHKASCECGAITTQPHIVSSGSNRCLLCGGIADMGFVKPDFVMNNAQNASNDYFVLPNGIIVMLSDNVQVYLQDRLINYRKGKWPVAK